MAAELRARVSCEQPDPLPVQVWLASVCSGRFPQGNRNHSRELEDKCKGQSQASKSNCRVQKSEVAGPQPSSGSRDEEKPRRSGPDSAWQKLFWCPLDTPTAPAPHGPPIASQNHNAACQLKLQLWNTSCYRNVWIWRGYKLYLILHLL